MVDRKVRRRMFERGEYIYLSLGDYEFGTLEEMISAYVKEHLSKAKEVIGPKLVELSLNNPDYYIWYNIEIDHGETSDYSYRIIVKLTLE